MAGLYLVVAAMFPVQIYFLYEHSPSEILQVFGKLTLLNWLVMIGLTIGATLFYRGSPRMIPMALGLGALVAVNNTVVSQFGEDYVLWQTVAATLLFAAMHLPLRSPEVQQLLEQPELRWWRTSYRQKMRIPISMRTKNYHHLNFETFDISDSGIYIAVSPETLNSLKGIKKDEVVEITLKFDTLNQIKCNARIARISNGGGQYACGIGLEFTDLTMKDRKRIHKFRAKNRGYAATQELEF